MAFGLSMTVSIVLVLILCVSEVGHQRHHKWLAHHCIYFLHGAVIEAVKFALMLGTYYSTVAVNPAHVLSFYVDK